MPSPTVTSPQVAVNDIGSSEDFLAAIDKTIKYFNDGDIVEGTIVKVDRDEVLLDIGYKTEGVIPARELSIKHDVDPNEVVSVGDEVEALVLTKEDKEGRLILSKKRAQYERAWGTIEALKEKDEAVKGTVIEVVKGGLILDIGLRGFLPASLVEMRRVRDLQPYIGKEIEAKIIELDKNRNNVVLSRRAWLEQTQSEVRSEFLNNLQKGTIRKGVVSSIVNFGAFVDLGGVDGLVHVSELSWKHIDHPSEVVQVGDEVTVEVLDVDMDRERVSLSLKATQEDPWRHFARTHAIGQIVPGKVTKLVPFGAFVRVEEGIEGLVHISELAERHVEVPDQVVAVGDDAMVKVIDIDLERRRISLSLKQANEDYTEEFDPAKYGMADSYDEQGNYIFPEGFDAETNEWLEGFEKQRAEWEARYAEAERRHKMHTAQTEKFAAAEAAGRGADDQSSPVAHRRKRPRVDHWPATPSWRPCGKNSPAALDLAADRVHVMLRIGLTGGIGAGKSLLSTTFSQCGGIVVDGDVLAREVVQPGTEGLASLVDAFGRDILLADGALDRQALAAKRFEMTSRAVCSTESCTRWSPGADPRSSRRFRGTRLWSKIFHCWWNPGWRHCFRWWWWCTPTSSYGCDGWSSNAAWPKPTPGLGSLRRPATSSVVPSPTSGWTTRAAQRIWCGGPATSGTRASSPSRTTWPNVRLRARRLGWCRRIQAGRIRRGASSTG